MLLKVYKSRVWMLLLMLLPFIGNAQIPGLPAGWGFTLNPTSATYAVPTTVTFDGVTPLAAGDWIGVFYQDGTSLECGGAIQWDGVNNVAVVAFGNDGLNPDKNGFADNEVVHWKFYYTATSEEICVKAYDALNAEFTWVNGDLDAVAKFMAFPIVTCPSNMLGVKTTDPAFTLTGGLPSGGTYSGPGVLGGVFTPSVAGVGTHTITYTFTEFDCSDFCTFTIEVIPGFMTQTINYSTGWNWISFNVLPATATVKNTMANFTPQNGDILKNQTQTMIYNAATSSWVPNLTMNPDRTYLLKTASPAGSFTVNGNYIDFADPISLNASGWTWIAYKPIVQRTPKNSFTLTTGSFTNQDIVKNQTQTALYNATLNNWIPTTFQMVPGRGYKMKYQSAVAGTLKYPAADNIPASASIERVETPAKAIAGDPGWETPLGFETNMSVYVTSATLNGVPVQNGKVGAFHAVTHECRGAEVFFDGGGMGQVVLTVVFNSEEAGTGFYYKVWNSDNDVIYEVNETGVMVSDDFQIVDLTLIPQIVSTTLSGTVTDEITNAPMSGVVITATPAAKSFGEGDPGWETPLGFETNMSVYVTSATLNGVPVQNGKVGAFHAVTNECRGAEVFFDGGGMGQVVLTVVFNSEEAGTGFYYKVWNSDNDVIYEVNETGVMVSDDFQIVDLTLIGGPEPLVTETNADGYYEFTDIPDGTYTVCTGPTPLYIDECADPVTTPPSAVVDFSLLPEITCSDVVISNFPAGFENLCAGIPFGYNFNGVVFENAASVEWSVDPVWAGEFDGTVFTLSPDYVGVLTISVIGYATPPCNDATASLQFEVYALPEVTCPNDFDVCINDAPWALYGASPEGGEFTGVGVIDNWFYPEVAGIGSFEITYTYEDGNGCVNSCSFMLTVNPLPTFDCPAYGPFCAGDAGVVFEGDGVYTFNGEVVLGFEPVAAGDFLFVYTVTNEFGCSASCEFTIVVNSLPDVICPDDFAVCEIETVQLVGGMPEGGFYSGDGVIEGVFNSIVAGPGPHTITYTFTDGNGCTNSCEFVITVNELPAPLCPEGFDICLDAEPVVLEGALPEGGTYGGDGVMDGVFYPETAGLGYHELFYTYTDPQTGCTGFCVFGVTVNPVPEIECPAYGPFCEGDDYVMFEGIGVYTFNGEVVQGFDPVASGDYLFEYTVTNEFGCDAMCEFVIVVNALPEVSCPADFWVCFDEQPWMLYGAEPEGGVYSGVGVMSGMFDPAAAGVGYHDITYTYTDVNGCTNFCTFEIHVKPLPEVYAGPDANIEAGNTFTLVSATVNNVDSFLWTTYGDGAFDDALQLNPTYTPGPNDIAAGSVVLELVGYSQYCGADYDQMTLFIGAVCMNPPTAFAGEDAAVCAGDSYLLADAAATNYINVQWYTLTGDGQFNDETALNPIYYPGLLDEITGYVELCMAVTPSDPLCQPVFDCMILTINPLPVVECPVIEPVCEGSDYIEFPIYEMGVYTDAAGEVVMGFDPMMAGTYGFTLTVTNEFGCTSTCGFEVMVYELPIAECPVFEPVCEGSAYIEFPIVEMGVYTDAAGEVVMGFDPMMAGTYGFTLTVTNEFGCTATCGFDVVVNPLPVFDCPAYGPFCEGDAAVVFEGEGVYTYMNEVVTGFDPVAAGDYMFVYTVTNEFGCSASCEFTIVVNPLPVFDCPAYGPFCEGDAAVVFEGEGVYTYMGEVVAGFDPVAAGDYMFVYTVTNEFGCSASCEFTIVVNPLPVFECPVYGPFCEGEEAVELQGPGVYTFDGVIVTEFEPIAAGEYVLVYTVNNEFGCTASCDVVIVVNPLPTYTYEVSATEVCINSEITWTEYFTGVAPWTVEFLWNGVLETFTTSDNPSITSELMDEAGVFVYEPISITDGNGCTNVLNQPVTITVLPLTEIVEQPVNVEVLYGEDAEFSVVAENATGYQWFEVGLGEIFGATGSTLMLENVTVNSAYYCEVYGDCNTVTSDVATLTILPWTQVIPFPARVNGMSTYLDLIDCDIATTLAPLGAANLQGAQFYQPTKIYAPGSPTFCWDETKGAAVTLKNNIWPTSISVTGFPTLGNVVNLGAGWNIIPVWSRGVVEAADVFGPLGNGVRAFTVDYTGVYWPQYNLYSLQYLVPGNAYFVFVPAATTISYDVPLVDATPGYVSLPPNMTSWNDVTLTGLQHIIAITTDALASLEVGDVIGAFNQNGTIAGMLEITNLNENTVLRVYGDESMTQEVEGFVNGDMMTFRVYRNGVELDVIPTFEQKLPNTSIFEVNGASAIVALKAGATSINEVNADLNVNVYPNPASSFVNIQTNFEIKSLKVVNYVGQVVFDQVIGQVNYQINTSDFVSGMYFVQIEANDGTVVTKRLTIN